MEWGGEVYTVSLSAGSAPSPEPKSSIACPGLAELAYVKRAPTGELGSIAATSPLPEP